MPSGKRAVRRDVMLLDAGYVGKNSYIRRRRWGIRGLVVFADVSVSQEKAKEGSISGSIIDGLLCPLSTTLISIAAVIDAKLMPCDVAGV